MEYLNARTSSYIACDNSPSFSVFIREYVCILQVESMERLLVCIVLMVLFQFQFIQGSFPFYYPGLYEAFVVTKSL